MADQKELNLPKWPFFVGDAVLLLSAGFILARAASPLTGWHAFLAAVCALAGASLAVAPFILEYRAAARLLESSGLVSTVAEIQHLELIAAQINAATARWQVVQEHSTNSVTAARDIAAKISTEAGSFREFLQKANDGEKANLRLEIEKLRRMEADWIQVVVRLLDHTYALHRAAERSTQRSVAEQTALFQNSCRDVARRMGLIPLIPALNDPFDSKLHHLPESQPEPAVGAQIRDILATGFTYQGRLIRPAMVVLHQSSGPSAGNGHGQSAATPNGSNKSDEEATLL
jgi:molecular chaperone GrpE (heat shock protein)